MKNKRSKTTRRRRGTIIILVVAVLALLAVIGTIYIISARTERAAANAAATNVNMVLAERAAMNSVVEIIGNAMYDSAGNVGGYDATTKTYGQLAARNYDYPDSPPLNFTTPALDLVDPATGATMVNGSATSMRGQPWLAPTLHNNSLTAFQTTAGDSYLTYNGFDPYTAKYDIPIAPSATPGTVPAINVVDDQTSSTVDLYNASTNPDGINLNTTQPPDAYWNLLPFSEASGIHYRYAIRILDTSRMANLNTGATDDTTATGAMSDTTGTYLTSVRLAPVATSTSTGTGGWLSPAPSDYYNASDTAANLQYPGTPPNGSGTGRAGTSTANSAFNLANWQRQVVLQIEKPQDSAVSLFDLSDELELRSYGEYGTTYHARPTLSNSAANSLWPYTLSADTASTTLNPNPSRSFPNTTGNVQGNPARRNYTTYSFTRDIRPYPDPGTVRTLSVSPTDPAGYPSDFPGFGTTPNPFNVWPTDPARAEANPDVVSLTTNQSSQTAKDNAAVFYIAAAATNITNAIQEVNGPSSTINPSFYAANYVAQRCNVYAQDIHGAYYLSRGSNNSSPYPANIGGPSFLDANGIHVRTCSSDGTTALERDFGSTTDLHSSDVNYVDLGYAAQPFINELAVKVYKYIKGGPTSPPVYAGIAWAVELYNPYNCPLSLKGFKLKYGSADSAATTIDLGVDANGADSNNYVPANGFYVIYSETDQTQPGLSTAPLIRPEIPSASSSLVVRAGLMPYDGSSKHTVSLMRQYWPTAGGNTPQYCTVDQFEQDVQGKAQNVVNPLIVGGGPPAGLVSSPTVPLDWDITWERATSNMATNPWSVTVENTLARNDGSAGTPVNGVQTLGKANSATAGNNLGVHLYDRSFENTPQHTGTTAGQPFTTGSAAHAPFISVVEFNHILHEASAVNPTSNTANGLTESGEELTAYLNTDAQNAINKTLPKFVNLNTNDAYAAQLYFYFSVDPKIYNTSPPADNPVNGDVDICSVNLLDCITFIDRISDPTIDMLNLPGNVSKLDINKIRLPGKININTASGDVLRALPGIQVLENATPGVAVHIIGNILAYRARTSTSGNTNYPATKDYSSQATYPGYGFRSLVEVEIPINDAQGGRPVADATIAATVFDNADKGWSSIYNLCTVRSDTFVVYGYLEAVENGQNLANNNGNAWYSPTTSDNPTLGGPSLIRLSRLRWVAIVDRSFCNYAVGSPNFQMPRIVAIKDLPK